MREISNRAAQPIVFQVEKSVDQPATMQCERKFGQRWRFDLSVAPDLRYLVFFILESDHEKILDRRGCHDRISARRSP
jgi:hypothetical protein